MDALALREFKEVSEFEINEALKYASNKSGLSLDADMLRTLANKAGRLRIEKHCSLREAKHLALREHLRQRNRGETNRYGAYSCALAKLFSRRRGEQQAAEARRRCTSGVPGRNVRRAPIEPVVAITTTPSGQLEWLV